MAENRGVWGIDIGQAGLKAIRLKYAESAKQALAVAFDYIPHPKLLSQPDANPKELIQQALQTFLSRNDTRGDQIAISLPGSTALARFIQLPPVEEKKVADVVKYEAKQQIPFALEDVIWDFQTLGGGIVESGFMLGAEVGLFAMKRDQVAESLRPFNEAKVEVEVVQIAPLALYNFICYDQFGIRHGSDDGGTQDFHVVLDMGTDNTTLLVTNCEKIWIRNVPIGGNHFTRALLKEMKLTFAKAEHLKCNATKSPDPRAVFQALRPVFNEYVSEIQRSIGYFSSVNRDCQITKVIGVGNGFKLAGLQKFLQQNLNYEVERVETFKAVIGDTVLSAPVFQENIMAFVVPYGLALQTLNLTKIHTTLLPPEIARARRIRRKKPWALVTASSLLAGLALSSAGYASVTKSVSTERFGKQEKDVQDIKALVKGGADKYEAAKTEHKKLVDAGESLITYVDTRELWPELYRTINECLPRPNVNQNDIRDPTKLPILHIRSVTMKKMTETKTWFDALNPAMKQNLPPEDAAGPSGPGYIVTLNGTHYFEHQDGSPQFMRDFFIKNLQKEFYKSELSEGGPVPVRHLGISHPLLSFHDKRKTLWFEGGPPKGGAAAGLGAFGAPMPMPMPVNPPGQKGAEGNTKVATGPKEIWEYFYDVQFVWKPTPVKKRQLPAAATPAVDPNAQPQIGGDQGNALQGGAQPGVNTGVPGAAPAPGSLPGQQPAGIAPNGASGVPGQVPGATPQSAPGAAAVPGVQQPGNSAPLVGQ